MSHFNNQTVTRWLGAVALVASLVLAGVGTVQASPAAQQSTPTPTATLAAPAGYIAVVVKSGETLATFVTRYNVSAQAIIAANPALQKDPNVLQVGQVLLIPTTAATAAPTTVSSAATKAPTATLSAPAGYVAVKVQAGETLLTYVNRYKVSAQAIIAANPALQKDPSLLQIGQVLLIPVAAPTAAATIVATATAVPTNAAASGGFIDVVVQKGDTLLTYVNRYGVSAAAIITANPSIQRDPNLLQVGQHLRIPVVAPTATKAPASAATAVPTSAAAATAVPGNPSLPVPPPLANAQQVTLRAGESLLTISMRYGVSAGALLKANPQLGDSAGLVYPGQKINVPVARSTTPSRTTPFYYVLVSGDSLKGVGARFEISAETIAAANPGVTFNVGTEILIPAGPHLVAVQNGDELRKIAARYNTTVDFLLKGNSLPNPDKIYPGQLIFIPIQYDKAPLAFN